MFKRIHFKGLTAGTGGWCKLSTLSDAKGVRRVVFEHVRYQSDEDVESCVVDAAMAMSRLPLLNEREQPYQQEFEMVCSGGNASGANTGSRKSPRCCFSGARS